VRNELVDSPSLVKVIPSRLDEVFSLLGDARAFAEGSSHGGSTNLVIALRELAINAITHGNGSSPGLSVTCRVTRVGESLFEVTVEDEGEGFDHRAVCMDIPGDPSRLQKRGYILIKSVSEEIRFNEKGNRVTVVVALEQGAE
jgi:anti-sigma regulatory factor (Ser/Thr protein kinase)